MRVDPRLSGVPETVACPDPGRFRRNSPVWNCCRLRSHPATDYLQGDGPLSLSVALPDRLTQITYAIRVKALLVSHRTYRVRTHSGFFRALFVAAAVFRGSPSLFGVVAGACIAVSLLRIVAAGVLLL